MDRADQKVALGACRELAPSKKESTTYEPSLVCKLLSFGCRPLIPDRLLVWIYTGQKPSERLEAIGSIDGQHLELIAVGNAEVQRAAELFSFSRPDISLQALDSVSMQAIWQAIPPETKALVFWIDDEKLVSPGFPLKMAAPILESDPARERHLHYWDGNALAISRSIAEAMTLEDMNLRDDCLLSMMSDIVDFRGAGPRGSSVRVMFSPLEKFAAMAMEPMGLAS